MKTVAVLNRKGGVGKTTLATNLARAIQLRGLEVVLVDTDPQGSARDWASTNEDVEVPVTVDVDRPVLDTELPRLKGYDVAVIDGVAKMERMSASAVKASDLVLIPIRPSALSMWTAGELVDLIKSRQEVTGGPHAAFVLSQAIVGTNLAGEAEDALSRLELPVWSGTNQRVAYAKAVGQGVSVLDIGAEKASEEINALTDRTLDALNQSEQTDE
jgi:chromosome partitioning protein